MATWPGVDLALQGWMIPLLREVRRALADAPAEAERAPLEDAAAFERWLTERIDALPFGFDSDGATGRDVLLDSLGDQARLASWILPEGSGVGRSLDLAVVFAGSAGEPEAMRSLMAARVDFDRGKLVGDALTEAIREPMHRVGARLAKRLLQDDNPLLGRPFHRLITHVDARVVARLARASALGTLDERTVQRELARAEMQRLGFVEAVVALARFDGRVDRIERRLVQELVGIGRFERAQEQALRRALDGSDDVPSAAELAAGVADPGDRAELLKMVIVAALVDDDFKREEELFVEELADALEIEPARRVAIHVGVARAMLQQPWMTGGLRVGGILSRARRAAQRSVETFVRSNARHIVSELKETGQLVELLARSTSRDLTEEQQEAVRQQIRDILRSVPALALFAAPGGSLLLPVLAKVLPFSIAPSSWEAPTEDLEGDDPADREQG